MKMIGIIFHMLSLISNSNLLTVPESAVPYNRLIQYYISILRHLITLWTVPESQLLILNVIALTAEKRRKFQENGITYENKQNC